MRATTLTVGDRVQYRAAFLRSCGFYTGPVPFARGTVTQLERFGGAELVTVEWDGDAIGIPTRILSDNLKTLDTLEAS